MKAISGACRGRLAAVVVALALLTQAVPAVGLGQEATPVAGVAPLDLAAMTLTPDDLAKAGIDGFEIADGRSQTVADRAQAQAAEDGDDPAEVEAFLHGLGWIRGYRARLAHPIVEGEETFDSLVSSEVIQFASVDDGRTGFGIVSLVDVFAGDVTPVANGPVVGDQSVLYDLGEVTVSDGTVHEARRLLFQRDALVGDVVVFGALDRPFTNAEIEALATRLLERMDRVAATGGPGLSVKLLRWQGTGLSDADLDNYLKLDGPLLPALGDTAEDHEDTARDIADASDVYRYEAVLNEELFQITSVLQFSSGRSATAWVEDWNGRFTPEDAPEGYAVEEIADAPVFGDGSVVLKITVPFGTGVATSIGVLARIGDQGISFGIASSEETLDVDAVLTMIERQVACFEAGDCTASAPLPVGIGA